MTDDRSERVEPLTQEEEEALRAERYDDITLRWPFGSAGSDYELIQRLLATLDAARDAARQDRPASAELRANIARMLRLEGGCEKGHKAGQWHMHEEPLHALARALNAALASADAE